MHLLDGWQLGSCFKYLLDHIGLLLAVTDNRELETIARPVLERLDQDTFLGVANDTD